jgi:hypothetical protein
MLAKFAIVERKENIERIGPFALKALAFAACLAVFAPLLAAFVAPFIG